MTKKEKEDFLTKSPQELYQQYKKTIENRIFIKTFGDGSLVEEGSIEDVWDPEREFLWIEASTDTSTDDRSLNNFYNKMDILIEFFDFIKLKTEETASKIMEKFNVSRDEIEVYFYDDEEALTSQIPSVKVAFYIVETEIESFDDFEIRVNAFKQKNIERLRKQLEISGYSSQLLL